MTAVLDESAQTLFLTELFRGLNYTLKSFFDPKVTVSLLTTSQRPLVMRLRLGLTILPCAQTPSSSSNSFCYHCRHK